MAYSMQTQFFFVNEFNNRKSVITQYKTDIFIWAVWQVFLVKLGHLKIYKAKMMDVNTLQIIATESCIWLYSISIVHVFMQ